jgi:hypothetical protein
LELGALVRELAAALRMRPPAVRTLPGLSSPMVWGLGAPCLLWPRGLEKGLSGEGLRAVLIHELAHLKRRDHWVGWLLLAGACVWWWLPLFALVRRRLSQEAELACDAWVVAALPEARRAYAEALLEVCQRMSQAAPAAPAWGASGGRRDLERRLIMILRSRAPYRLTPCLLAGVGLLALLSIPAWTLGQPGPDAPRPRDPALKADTTVAVPDGGTVQLGGLKVVLDPAGPDADAAREKKVAELEAKLKELLKELKALRQSKTDARPDGKNVILDLDFAFPIGDTRPAPSEIALTRATYKLPAGKAEALAKFLVDNVKAAPVLECKVDGDSLIVTTTPEYQHAVGQLVGLMLGKLPAAHSNPKPDPMGPIGPARGAGPGPKPGAPYGPAGGGDSRPKGPTGGDPRNPAAAR